MRGRKMGGRSEGTRGQGWEGKGTREGRNLGQVREGRRKGWKLLPIGQTCSTTPSLSYLICQVRLCNRNVWLKKNDDKIDKIQPRRWRDVFAGAIIYIFFVYIYRPQTTRNDHTNCKSYQLRFVIKSQSIYLYTALANIVMNYLPLSFEI